MAPKIYFSLFFIFHLFKNRIGWIIFLITKTPIPHEKTILTLRLGTGGEEGLGVGWLIPFLGIFRQGWNGSLKLKEYEFFKSREWGKKTFRSSGGNSGVWVLGIG